MGSAPSPDDRPLADVSDLRGYFASGGKPSCGIGVEYERVGVSGPGAEALPYFGERSLSELLEQLAATPGWSAVREDGHIIELQRDACRLTLEPGAQLELSGAIHRSLHAVRDEVDAFVRHIAEASAPFGVRWLGLGLTPVSTPETIGWVPKRRYAIMSRRLGERGRLSHWMMKTTAGVQINLDYADERDAMEKLHVVTRATSTVTALFANSPLAGGAPTGFDSYRAHVWQHTDAERCGLNTFLLRPDAGFDTLLDYVLDVPMLFIIRDGAWLDPGRRTFRDYLASGFDGHRATVGDWELHLSTLFPEVRIKRHLEVRGADSGSAAHAVALAALWTGLLYPAESRRAVLELLGDVGEEELEATHREMPRRGLEAELAGRSLLEVARELVAIAEAGLGGWEPGTEPLLAPARAILERGRSPGRELARLWTDVWGGDVTQLMRHCDTAPQR